MKKIFLGEKIPSDRIYWQSIWDKFKSGDRKAFEIIYKEFIDVLFAYGSKLSSDKLMIEDSIQDLFLDIYTYNTKLRKIESLEFYLLKSLKRIIIRKLKEVNRFSHPEQFDLFFTFENEKGDQIEQKLEHLQNELKNLDAKKRELIFLKFNSGLTYVEIGKLLDMKPDTVKKQITRLLRYLRTDMEKEYLIPFLFLCFIT